MAKTPSALKWMIDQRARLLGEIKKIDKRYDARESELQKEIDELHAQMEVRQKKLARIQRARCGHMELLQRDLASIDSAMGQHKVLVDTDLISSIQTQDSAWYLPPGAMTRYILRALREANGDVLTTNEVALFVVEEGKLTVHPDDFRSLKIAIRRRMRALHSAGFLRRIEIGTRTMDSRWAALRSNAQSEADVLASALEATSGG
jgi:hypothetical protein